MVKLSKDGEALIDRYEKTKKKSQNVDRRGLTDSADDFDAEIGWKFADVSFFRHHASGLVVGHGRMEGIFATDVAAVAGRARETADTPFG